MPVKRNKRSLFLICEHYADKKAIILRSMLRGVIALLRIYIVFAAIRHMYKYMRRIIVSCALLHNSLNLHFDSINFSAMISALCRKGNLLEVTLRRNWHGTPSSVKRTKSVYRRLFAKCARAAITCPEITGREFGCRAKCKD